MAVLRNGTNLAYGLDNALQSLAPEPIFANRAPSSTDIAALGTFWYYNASPVEIFIFTSSGTWTQLTTESGSGVFASLTVNGATALNGALTVSSGTSAINIGTDAVAKTITMGNVTGATAVNVNAGTGGITLNTNSTGKISIVSHTATSATTSVTNNALVGSTTITGLTTASGSTDVITLSNSLVTAANCVLVSASNLDASGNHAGIGIQSIVQSAGSLVITLKNNGAGALGTGDNVLISHMVLG